MWSGDHFCFWHGYNPTLKCIAGIFVEFSLSDLGWRLSHSYEDINCWALIGWIPQSQWIRQPQFIQLGPAKLRIFRVPKDPTTTNCWSEPPWLKGYVMYLMYPYCFDDNNLINDLGLWKSIIGNPDSKLKNISMLGFYFQNKYWQPIMSCHVLGQKFPGYLSKFKLLLSSAISTA